VLARSASATPSSFARYGPRAGPRLAHSSACRGICFAITSLPTESARLSMEGYLASIDAARDAVLQYIALESRWNAQRSAMLAARRGLAERSHRMLCAIHSTYGKDSPECRVVTAATSSAPRRRRRKRRGPAVSGGGWAGNRRLGDGCEGGHGRAEAEGCRHQRRRRRGRPRQARRRGGGDAPGVAKAPVFRGRGGTPWRGWGWAGVRWVETRRRAVVAVPWTIPKAILKEQGRTGSWPGERTGALGWWGPGTG
jgi:hypothetical protein